MPRQDGQPQLVLLMMSYVQIWDMGHLFDHIVLLGYWPALFCLFSGILQIKNSFQSSQHIWGWSSFWFLKGTHSFSKGDIYSNKNNYFKKINSYQAKYESNDYFYRIFIQFQESIPRIKWGLRYEGWPELNKLLFWSIEVNIDRWTKTKKRE
jgi:hypothetical protein